MIKRLFDPRVFALVALLGTAAALLGELPWPVGLLIHGMLTACAACVLAALYAVLWRRWKLALFLILVAALASLWPLGPGLAGAAAPEGTPTDEISFVYANLFTANGHHATVAQQLAAANPDLVALLEVDESWMADLEALRRELPHVVARPRPDNFGIALFSRYPVVHGGLVELSGDYTQIDVTLRGPAGPLQILVGHPPPPVNRWCAADNQRIHRELARRAAESQQPLVLAGDFNATPWSPDFRHLVAAGGFQRRPLECLRPTWPCTPLFPLLGIPIDAILVRGPLRLVDRELLPLPGSDHLGIRARLLLLGG